MFESCNTAKETQRELIDIISAVELTTVQKHIAKSFYNADGIVKFLYTSIIAGGNGILYGPGGFGKSEITKAFFNYFDIIPLVFVGHSGTDIESLLGIPNIKKLTDESIYEIAFEKSIFNKAGVLILEEFLDVKPSVATALKDIITAGGYRRGDEFIPNKIGAMFICSNKAPDEVVIDFSTAAFYKERFPYSLYVIWDDFSVNAYLNLFKLIYSEKYEDDIDSFKLIAELCSSSCNIDTIISPRMAFDTVNLFLINKEIDSLDMISSINTSKINEIQTRLRLENQYKHLNSKFLDLINYISSLKIDNIKEIAAFISFYTFFKKDISKYPLEGDALLKTIASLINIMEVKKVEADTNLIELGKNIKLNKINETYEDIHQYIS